MFPFFFLSLSLQFWTPITLVPNTLIFHFTEKKLSASRPCAVDFFFSGASHLGSALHWCSACLIGNGYGLVHLCVTPWSCAFLLQSLGDEAGEEAVDESTSHIHEQASFAVNKLRELNEKLEYKRQALNSIQNAPKPDKKVTLSLSRLSFNVSIF